MMRRSCIYEGAVRHHRFGEVEHAFRSRLFMMYLDLDELPNLFAGSRFWSSDGPALAEFRRSDYPGPAEQALDESIRDLVESRIRRRPQGPIALLTHLRYFGYGFNPVSLFYCFDRSGDALDAVVADVSNTPWGERHCYVVEGRGGGMIDARIAKQFHVSPFMPMDLEHRFRFSKPGHRLFVGIDDWRGEDRRFSARLALHRREIDRRSLAGVLLRFPAMTAQVIAGIYFQALRLYWKGAPYYEHPGLRAGRQSDCGRQIASPPTAPSTASSSTAVPEAPARGRAPNTC